MLKKILIGLVVIVIGFVAFVWTRPSDFRTTRSATIGAAPEVVFAQVNDFHKWTAWNPWDKIDPAMKQSYEGAASGVGAVYSWDGNNEVGAGRMTILESRPSELIRIKMEFLKPFEGLSTAEFTFAPQGGQTLVTWSLFGPNTFIGKAMSLFIDSDKMIGDMFVKGLASLKAVSEAAPQ